MGGIGPFLASEKMGMKQVHCPINLPSPKRSRTNVTLGIKGGGTGWRPRKRVLKGLALFFGKDRVRVSLKRERSLVSFDHSVTLGGLPGLGGGGGVVGWPGQRTPLRRIR